MSVHYFFDLPVYRLSAEKYYAQREDHVARTMHPAGNRRMGELIDQMKESNPDSYAAWQDTIRRSYGGPWEFNEIIGYIRLHIIGTQVRGEYYDTGKKRVVRSRIKRFALKTWKLAPEVEIEAPHGNPQVLAAIRRYIAQCQRELPRRHIDCTTFDFLAPHIEWQSIVQSSNA